MSGRLRMARAQIVTARRALPGVWIVFLSVTISAQSSAAVHRFDFGFGPVAEGFIQVTPNDAYDDAVGYGLHKSQNVETVDRGGDPLRSDFCTSDKPFFFSVKLPEGNYRVTVTLGDVGGDANATVKAELRRLMVEKLATKKGDIVRRTFLVNTRTPRIDDDREVRLKPRERQSEWPAWDDKLTLEFNGARPCVCAVEIERDETVPTLYLIGDSTVCDQPAPPWNSWGQMLTRFFSNQVAVANHAESGESIRGSLSAGRFDKVFSLLKPGDFLALQFGHNDMKSRTHNALEVYTTDLRQLVAKTRKLGGQPILITSMERKSGVENDTLAGYPDAVRQVAREESIPLIDLHVASKQLYRALGDDLDLAFQDGTHHNNYGSYQLAQCVVEEIRRQAPELAKHLASDVESFDPRSPDDPHRFAMPASPGRSPVAPLGN